MSPLLRHHHIRASAQELEGPSASAGIRKRWLCLGLLIGGLLGIAYTAPASGWSTLLSQQTHNRVLLLYPSGTLWKGSAVLALNGGTGSQDARLLPGRLQWEFEWVRQPHWGVSVQVRHDHFLPQGEALYAHRHGGDWLVSIGQNKANWGQWPLSLLAGLGTPWNTLSLDGSVGLTTQQLQIRLGSRGDGTIPQIKGQATVDMQNVSSRVTPLKPLGHYTLQWQATDPSRALLTLQTRSGALQLSGSGQWTGNRLGFRGEAWAEPAYQQALNNLLNIIGRRQGDRSLINL